MPQRLPTTPRSIARPAASGEYLSSSLSEGKVEGGRVLTQLWQNRLIPLSGASRAALERGLWIEPRILGPRMKVAPRKRQRSSSDAQVPDQRLRQRPRERQLTQLREARILNHAARRIRTQCVRPHQRGRILRRIEIRAAETEDLAANAIVAVQLLEAGLVIDERRHPEIGEEPHARVH